MTDRTRALLQGAIFLALAALPMVVDVAAEPLWAIPNPRARDGKWVSDETRALRVETVSRLNSAITDLERSTGAEMAVVVVRSLEGMTIEDAASRLFGRWGIGKKGRDNGLLLLWSIGDRRVRVEVGYGLEAVLPDGKVGAILDNYLIPRFKEGEFDAGMIMGVDALLKAVRAEPLDLPLPATGSYERERRPRMPLILGLLGGVPAVLAVAMGWRKWRRHRPRWCPQCRTRMHRLNEAQDDELLEPGQVAEERVGSVDYDVWKCPACAHHFTLRHPKQLRGYARCPQCQNHTKLEAERVTLAPTAVTTGTATVTEFCAFCTFTREYTKEVPCTAAASGSASQRSSSFSSGDDYHGGGSRSSSSSSSSSFGGGRSGGGGASRSY